MLGKLLLAIALAILASTPVGYAQTTQLPPQHQNAPQAAAFQSLLNNSTLDGWWGLGTEDPRAVYAADPEALAKRKAESQADINAHWTNHNGILTNDGQGLYLTTDKLFGDFELLLEYKTVPNADSGIYLRGCPQVQIWDSTEAGGKWELGADKGSGGLWNNSPNSPGKDPLTHADKPFGQWNLLHIIMVGERVSVWLNAEQVVNHARMENYFDRSLPLPRLGPIQLQTHGGEISWRNIFIREIAPDEANTILASHGTQSFEPIFNGRDFTGWAGPTDNYEIIDGALRCRPDHGGTIYTEEEYEDFAVRFEFKLPPGGNNGLAIRYPGSGDTAYVGMCELQVLDSQDPRYANIDPRQHHASVYAQAPAHRGYLRKPGEWNFQEVTVIGSRITVELNGTRILDTDLSTITDFMYPPEKFPGRTRTRGHFGFAGHNDPVEFRNIRIKRIGE
ncbi:hypothetical protein MNBD_PLANCTO03-2090 [hydrothermal vent metagenome]|uniref:3-keto-alpha-glucoside-1,2-lyase/3-keto-2-hydroxy-glucal hydratase domain-containing protein n=1 Tax=hydrothermal vent metagenome TaxID=652676 RepID=A0A3B1DTT1_9ZZZZ